MNIPRPLLSGLQAKHALAAGVIKDARVVKVVQDLRAGGPRQGGIADTLEGTNDPWARDEMKFFFGQTQITQTDLMSFAGR